MVDIPALMTLEELRALPVPEFTERDTDVLKRDLIARFEEITGRPLYPAQVENFMINLMAYALSNVGSAVQYGLSQNRVALAEGVHLDALGANVGTYRLSAQAARVMVEFTLSEVRNSAVVIPVNTRVAAGSTLTFATVAELVIPAGAAIGETEAVAAGTGEAFNNLQPGQVQDILDPVAYVSSVANTQVSAGGSDVESDDRFRERIANAFERITRGGSRQGYIELVKAAHPDIIDVAVIHPEPGYIHVYPLMETGVAEDAIDAAILTYLDPETKIPMGDYVSVHKVEPQIFDVVVTLKVLPGYASGAVVQAETAVRALFDTWGQTLGVQVAPSAVVEAVRAVPGVVGVTGPAFAFTDLGSTEFASLGNLTVTLTEAPNV